MGNKFCWDDKRNEYKYHANDLEGGDQNQVQAIINNVQKEQEIKLKYSSENEQSERDDQSSQQEIPNGKQDKQIAQQSLVAQLGVDDNLSEYNYDYDSDQEIQEMSIHRNEFEKDVKFTKRGLIEEIETTLTYEDSEEQSKQWDLKLSKDDVKIFIKKGGSKFNTEQPYIKTVVLFNAHYSMRKVVEVVRLSIVFNSLLSLQIFNEKHRMKWDKNVLKLEIITQEFNKNVWLNYQLNKSPLNFSNRDFLDKQIKFRDRNNFYCYYSTIPLETQNQIKPIPPKVERAQTIFGLQKLSRRPQDGKIEYVMIMQCDLKMKITPKLIGMFLPAGLQEWARKCNKYIADNYDTI
ncbi:UNKNOWN [Stylonychia lemnae]|uniref:START domain-containing protein n=1 Tax=Stylonychia lemnae TaxID=5949 RepID=A0A078B1N3_STYLE|nr:UNKNOWN [Stylonychia lemnae]|eukprot:CDW87198.1 UNKNOWN [Stylonychia lemnae]